MPAPASCQPSTYARYIPSLQVQLGTSGTAASDASHGHSSALPVHSCSVARASQTPLFTQTAYAMAWRYGPP